MWGLKDNSVKVEKGQCVFPYHIRSLDKEGKSTGWKKHFDCIPSIDGPICATKVNKRVGVRGRKKPLYEYLETDKKLTSKKGYCKWKPYFERETKKINYRNMKPNPNCIKKYKLKRKDPVSKEKKIIDFEGCIPDQNKNLDKENPEFICPVELNKDGVFENKHKSEKCFIPK
jgi:hypothetical protein